MEIHMANGCVVDVLRSNDPEYPLVAASRSVNRGCDVIVALCFDQGVKCERLRKRERWHGRAIVMVPNLV